MVSKCMLEFSLYFTSLTNKYEGTERGLSSTTHQTVKLKVPGSSPGALLGVYSSIGRVVFTSQTLFRFLYRVGIREAERIWRIHR